MEPAELLKSNFTFIAIVMVVTFIWAYLRVGKIPDEEQQRLPRSFAPRLFFATTYLVIYLLLIFIGYISPQIITGFVEPMLGDEAKTITDALKNVLPQVPLLAMVLMGAMFSLPQIREIEQRYAIFLHSAQYRKRDESDLSWHLANCKFSPSDQEINDNVEYLRQFGIFITDREKQHLNLESVGAWRKVSTLLRTLDEAEKIGDLNLPQRHKNSLAPLKESHRRKTQLAMDIIRMIEKMEKETSVDPRIIDAATQLQLAHKEAQNSQIDIDLQPAEPRPLLLSMQEMNQYLAQIERYFLTEYQIMVDKVSKLAARSILHSGDHATERLERLKQAGFQGLGRIENVNLDNVLWVLLTSWVATFAGYALLNTLRDTPLKPAVIVSISTVIAIAVFVGAMWGARRNLAEKTRTPWAAYFRAGLLAIGGFVFVQITRYLLDPEQILLRFKRRFGEAVESWGLFDYLLQMLPYSITAFFLTMGICWLARQLQWQNNNPLHERVNDGLMLGVIYFLGGIMSQLTHYAFGTNAGLRIAERIANQEWFSLFSSRIMGLFIGFIIGVIVIRDIRRISHAQIIQSKKLSEADNVQGRLDAAGIAKPPRYRHKRHQLKQRSDFALCLGLATPLKAGTAK